MPPRNPPEPSTLEADAAPYQPSPQDARQRPCALNSTPTPTPAPAVFAPGSIPRLLLVALGLATIDLIWVIKPGVEPSQHALYHWSGTVRSLFAPMALDMLAAWLLIALLLLAARRPGRLRVAIWSALLLFIPWFVQLDGEFLALLASRPHLRRQLFVAAFALSLTLILLWRPAVSSWFERIVSSASSLLIFAGIFGLFLFCRLGWYAWQGSRMEDRAHLQPTRNPTIQPHRLIWIVFDEMSYQQTFEHRFPGLQMPAFDRLAAQSTVFSHVVPIGTSTEVVLPGLLSGEAVDDIRTSPTGEFSLHHPNTGKWELFNQHNTSFQDARDAGYGTAIAGWYNPYCHLLPAVLDHCMWTHRFGILNNMEPSGTIAWNLLQPLKQLTTELIHVAPGNLQQILLKRLHIPTQAAEESALHIADYNALYAASDRLLRDRSAGFVLLHLPVPHPEGIYNRQTGAFATSGSTYMDNLALADKCLAGLRQTLEDTGQWDSSTIVIMGDHSWRTTWIWEATREWTPAEQQASLGGGYDERPIYLIKLPHQTSGSKIDTPFHAVNTRTLFDAVLLHRIATTTDLDTWLQTLK
jgi:hypothetical protein